MELARRLTWADERAGLFYYRTKDKIEVDAVPMEESGIVALWRRPGWWHAPLKPVRDRANRFS
jgi:hypothetical protein